MAFPAKTLGCKLARLPQLAVVGFERPEVCRHPSLQIHLSRFPVGIYVLPSARRSPCTERKALVSVRLHGRSNDPPRPFPRNFDGMQRHAQGVLNIERQQRNGMRIARHAGQSSPSWRRTTPCGSMLKIGSQVSSLVQTGTSWTVLKCLGRRDGLCADNIADGQRLGALSRSPAVCRLILRMTR